MTMTVAEMRAALAETHRPRVRDDERAAHRLRGAAVLLALVERDAGWSVILQQRSQALAAHRGQIALPGGAVESGETEIEAALREADEEVGLAPAAATVLGRLRDYVTVTRFVIAPVVAAVTSAAADAVYVRQPDEVARVFEVPLRWLHAERRLRSERREWHDLPADAPLELLREREAQEGKNDGAHEVMYYDTPEGTIWGVTARILFDFVEACGPRPAS